MDDKLMNSHIDAMGSVGTDGSLSHQTRTSHRARKETGDGYEGVHRTAAARHAHRGSRGRCGAYRRGSALVLPRLTRHNIPISTRPGSYGFVPHGIRRGEKVDGMDNAVMTSTDALMGLGSWAKNDEGTYSLQYLIDPNCLGNDVVSIECRLPEKRQARGVARSEKRTLGESPGTPMLRGYHRRRSQRDLARPVPAQPLG